MVWPCPAIMSYPKFVYLMYTLRSSQPATRVKVANFHPPSPIPKPLHSTNLLPVESTQRHGALVLETLSSCHHAAGDRGFCRKDRRKRASGASSRLPLLGMSLPDLRSKVLQPRKLRPIFFASLLARSHGLHTRTIKNTLRRHRTAR